MSISTHTVRVWRTARYCVYGEPRKATEVWFLLHGYGQLAEEFLQSCLPLAREHRLLVAPEALSRFYSKGFFEGVGASWMTKSARESEVEDYLAYLNTVGDAILSRTNTAHGRDGDSPQPAITVLGFSQGAATASRWAAMGSISPSRLICWAGDVAHDIADAATSLSGIELTMVYGERDKLITPDRKAEYIKRLDASGLPYRVISFDGGHRLDNATLEVVGG